MMTRSFQDLKIWQKGLFISLEIYNATVNFPDEEKFGLISQMRRSAVSIPSNIAEGWGRYNKKEFVQFLRISKGSLCELQTQLIISKKINLVDDHVFEKLMNDILELNKMLLSFINKCSTK